MRPEPRVSLIIKNRLWSIPASIKELRAVLMESKNSHQDKDENEEDGNI